MRMLRHFVLLGTETVFLALSLISLALELAGVADPNQGRLHWEYFAIGSLVAGLLIAFYHQAMMLRELTDRDGIRKAIRAIAGDLASGNAILELCGRPREQMVGADPMHFMHVCLPKIRDWNMAARDTLLGHSPDHIDKLINVGDVYRNTDDKAASIQMLERQLTGLGEVLDDLRVQLRPRP